MLRIESSTETGIIRTEFRQNKIGLLDPGLYVLMLYNLSGVINRALREEKTLSLDSSEDVLRNAVEDLPVFWNIRRLTSAYKCACIKLRCIN